MSVSAVLSGEPLLGKEKSCPGIRERPDQVSPRQAGGGERGSWGGLYEVRQNRGIEIEGKKKMV